MTTHWIRLFAVAALAPSACGGTVKQDAGTPAEQLQASGVSRCQAACAKVAACGLDKNSCSCGCACPAGTATCECPPCECPTSSMGSPSECEGDCSDAIQRSLASVECAPAMLALLDCLAAASCDAGKASCKAESDAMKTCLEKKDPSHTSPPPVGSGRPSSSGAEPGVSCALGSGGGSVPASGTTLPPGALFCESGWESCSDGNSYSVECDVTSGADFACTCSVNGAVQASFTATASSCPSDVSAADRLCGWNLQ